MAGEVVKGTVNSLITSTSNRNSLSVALDPNGNQIINESFGYNYNSSTAIANTIVNAGDDVASPKLLIEQGKQFQTKQITFDAAVPSANVANTINDRINTWVSLQGKRYDDFQVIINPSGLNHDITVIIIRYY